MTEPTTIARRTTFDGKALVLWSDGRLTQAMGYAIKGIGQPRTEEGEELALRAAWLVLDDAAIYDLAEVPRLFRAAKRALTVCPDRPVSAMRKFFNGWRLVSVNKGAVRRWVAP